MNSAKTKKEKVSSKSANVVPRNGVIAPSTPASVHRSTKEQQNNGGEATGTGKSTAHRKSVAAAAADNDANSKSVKSRSVSAKRRAPAAASASSAKPERLVVATEEKTTLSQSASHIPISSVITK